MLYKHKTIDNKLKVGCQKCGRICNKMITLIPKDENNGADEHSILCFNCYCEVRKNEK